MERRQHHFELTQPWRHCDQSSTPHGRSQDARALQEDTAAGAATSILLAASPEPEGVTGRYFDDCNEAEIVDERREQPIGTVAGYALDPGNADRLWAVAEKMIRADQ